MRYESAVTRLERSGFAIDDCEFARNTLYLYFPEEVEPEDVFSPVFRTIRSEGEPKGVGVSFDDIRPSVRLPNGDDERYLRALALNLLIRTIPYAIASKIGLFDISLPESLRETIRISEIISDVVTALPVSSETGLPYLPAGRVDLEIAYTAVSYLEERLFPFPSTCNAEPTCEFLYGKLLRAEERLRRALGLHGLPLDPERYNLSRKVSRFASGLRIALQVTNALTREPNEEYYLCDLVYPIPRSGSRRGNRSVFYFDE